SSALYITYAAASPSTMSSICSSTRCQPLIFPGFSFTDTATTEIYTLSLHDALPISSSWLASSDRFSCATTPKLRRTFSSLTRRRSEEHTSELQSHLNLVCRLLLEKKNYTNVDLIFALTTVCVLLIAR